MASHQVSQYHTLTQRYITEKFLSLAFGHPEEKSEARVFVKRANDFLGAKCFSLFMYHVKISHVWE